MRCTFNEGSLIHSVLSFIILVRLRENKSIRDVDYPYSSFRFGRVSARIKDIVLDTLFCAHSKLL